MTANQSAVARDRLGLVALLKEVHATFLSWEAGGSLRYARPGWPECLAPDAQSFYDTYHDSMWRDGEGFSFSIQVSDSPTGDNWWSGYFTLDGDNISLGEQYIERR